MHNHEPMKLSHDGRNWVVKQHGRTLGIFDSIAMAEWFMDQREVDGYGQVLAVDDYRRAYAARWRYGDGSKCDGKRAAIASSR